MRHNTRYSAFLHFGILFALLVFKATLAVGQANRTNFFAVGNAELNFNSTPVQVLRTFAPHANLGMGVMSNEAGALLIYSDGYNIWNRKHTIVPNGSELSTTQESVDRTLIVPRPGSPDNYYVITTHPWSDGLYYSEVDIALDGGYGAVIEKSKKIISNTSSFLSAVHHTNGNDIWVMTHTASSNKYHAILITENGISTTPISQSIGQDNWIYGGQMKFSPDGKKLAVPFEGQSGVGICVFDFNGDTGVLSNPIELKFEDPVPIAQGLEFSSDGTRLYAGEVRSESVYQFDLSKGTKDAIQATRSAIGSRVSNNSLYQFQLAADGNIYCTKGGGGGGTEHLGIIRNPNNDPSGVYLDENNVFLEGGDSFVNFTPAFVQSYLFKTSFNATGSCAGEPVAFSITNEHLLDSVLWSFGDGSAARERSPQHKYKDADSYSVKLTAYYDGKSVEIFKEVTIDPVPQFDLGADVMLCQEEKLLGPENLLSYQWSTSETTRAIRISETGRYYVTVQNEFNCFATDTIHVAINSLPQILLPDSIQLVNGVAELVPGEFQSYEWNTGDIGSTLIAKKPGWYSVKATNEFGCDAAKSVFVHEGDLAVARVSKWIRLNPKPSEFENLDMAFIDDMRGFIINGAQVVRTIDGGENWNEQVAITGGRRIRFSGPIGYIVGDNGSFYKSTHNGDGWNKVIFPYAENLNSINIINNMLLVTSDQALFVSNDGGINWERRSVNIQGIDVQDSWFTSAQTGHLACRNGKILKTTDGGATWKVTERVDYFPSDYLRITFANENVGYASRDFTELYKTEDGGETWHDLNFTGQAIYAIQTFDENRVIVSGEYGAILKSSNGGDSWESITYRTAYIDGNDFFAVHFIDENIGFATGLQGRIIKTENGGRGWDEYAITHEQVRQIELPAGDLAYALLWSDILMSVDNGNTWVVKNGPLKGQRTMKIDFLDSSTGFALAPGQYHGSTSLYKTVDGGNSWNKTRPTDIAGTELSCLYFINQDVGFVSGGWGFSALQKTSDGGVTWKNVHNKNIGEVQFVSETVGYARTSGYSTNYLYKTGDAGETWTQIFQIAEDITAISFASESTGYIFGDSGLAYKTTNGGSSFEKMNAPYVYYVDAHFATKDFGYAVGDYGELYSTKDGGLTWQNDPMFGYSSRIRTINSSAGDIFIAGVHGVIYRSGDKNDFVNIKSIVVKDITETSAFLYGELSAGFALTNPKAILKINSASGNFTQSFDLGTIQSPGSFDFSQSLTDLDPATTYYCSVSLFSGNQVLRTKDVAFTTLGPVLATIEELNPDVLVYPNPVEKFLHIEINSPGANKASIELLDAIGRQIQLKKQAVGSRELLDLSTVPGGIYLLTVSTATSKKVFRIVKR